MTALSEDVKRRIVVELASFRTTAEVAIILMREYDLEVRPNDLCRYDATKEYFVGGAALFELFRATRRKFVHDVSAAPIACQGYRLRRLQRLSEAVERNGNFKLAAALLEQAAKEIGGFYVKVRPGIDPDAVMGTAEAISRLQAYVEEEVQRRLAQHAEIDAPSATASAEATVESDGGGDALREDQSGPEEAAEPWPTKAAAQAFATALSMNAAETSRVQPFGHSELGERVKESPQPAKRPPEEANAPEPLAAPDSDRDAEAALRDRVAGVTD